MENYCKYWSSATPGLFIILVNQNISDLKIAKQVVNVVNNSIDKIIQMNFDGDAPKNRCFISVIGYNHNVKELCSGWLKDLDANPLRYETLKKKTPDGAGGIIEVEIKQPVWVEPITQDGATNMLGAFQLAKNLAKKWIEDNSCAPAPVIINISDGMPFYEGKDTRICMQETVSLAKEIMNFSTKDGNVLIFNACYLESNFKEDIFSFNIESFICNISSYIPLGMSEFVNQNCRDCGLNSNFTKGYICNDNINNLNVFIRAVIDEIFSRWWRGV